MTPKVFHREQRSKGVSLFRVLFLSFSLVSFASCLLIGTLTYYLNASRIRSDQYRFLETLRDEKIGTLSVWFREMSVDASVLVARQDIRTFCQTPGAGKAVPVSDMVSSLTTVRNAYGFRAVFLADKNGTTIASTETEASDPGNLPMRQETVKQVVREKKDIVSDVLFSKIHRTPTIFFFSPVFSSTAEMIGVLGILLDPEVSLYPGRTHSLHLGETGEILLVNSDGLVQSPWRYRDDAVRSRIIQRVPAQRGAAGQAGKIAIDDYRLEPVMAAYGHIAGLNWGIVVKQDMAEINVPVRAMATYVSGISAGALIIALIAGFLIARRIAHPSLKIAEAADLIGKGNRDIRLQPEGPAEIQQIALNIRQFRRLLGTTRVTLFRDHSRMKIDLLFQS